MRVPLAQCRFASSGRRILPADSVRRLKLAPGPYRMAAQRLDVSVERMRLISTQAWDIAGALHAECAAALTAWPSQPFDPLVLRPNVAGEGLTDGTSRSSS